MNNGETTRSQPADVFMADIHHRVRYLEQNLPPRVQVLETAVAEFRAEFRDMRAEQNAASKDTRDALAGFSETLSHQGRKITYASGAFWAAAALFTFAAANFEHIATFFVAFSGAAAP